MAAYFWQVRNAGFSTEDRSVNRTRCMLDRMIDAGQDGRRTGWVQVSVGHSMDAGHEWTGGTQSMRDAR